MIFRVILILLIIQFSLPVHAQEHYLSNASLMVHLNRDAAYVNQRSRIAAKYKHVSPGQWGEFVKGVNTGFVPHGKEIALTFDACGGPKGKGYDAELVDYLRKEHVPATLFVSGRWIDANEQTLRELARDTLFEIENHGLYHRPCSLDGDSAYHIRGTRNASEAFDELEANALKIEKITGRKPSLYRSSTAFINEGAVKLSGDLGIHVVSYRVLSGDAVPYAKTELISDYVIRHASPGAVVIMHFNHPERNTCEALHAIIPALKARGYRFVRLGSQELVSRK